LGPFFVSLVEPFFISSLLGFCFLFQRFNFLQWGCSPVIATLSHTSVLATLSLSLSHTHTHRLLVFLSVLTWGLLPLFSVVIREAGGEDCCIEPAQEHKEVILGDVSNDWLWSNFIHSFGLGGELGCGCCGCRFKDMYMHFNKRSRLMPLWSLKMFMKSS
jgi:hypothetical protein